VEKISDEHPNGMCSQAKCRFETDVEYKVGSSVRGTLEKN